MRNFLYVFSVDAATSRRGWLCHLWLQRKREQQCSADHTRAWLDWLADWPPKEGDQAEASP